MGAIAPIKVSKLIVSSSSAPGYPLLFSPDLNDALATTFSPEGFTQNGVAKWVDREVGIPLLFPSYTLAVRPASRQSQISRVTAKLVVPTADITSPSTATGIQPAPSKAYDITFNVEALIPSRCTLAERKSALSMLLCTLVRQVMANDNDPVTSTGAPFVEAVENLDSPY